MEFFLSDNKLYVNEIAPRPHNSGHFSLDACNVSQFDQQVFALVGENLKDIKLEKNAVMLNLLGDLWFKNGRAEEPNFDEVDDIDVNIHLYGKHSPRKGRKMGHITIVGDNVDKLIDKAEGYKIKIVEDLNQPQFIITLIL